MKKCPSSLQCWDSNPGTSRHESPPITTRPGLLFYFLVDQNHLIIPLQNIQKSFQSIGQLHFGQSAIALNPVSTNNFQPIRALQNECFLIFYCKYLLKSGLGDVILGCPPPWTNIFSSFYFLIDLGKTFLRFISLLLMSATASLSLETLLVCTPLEAEGIWDRFVVVALHPIVVLTNDSFESLRCWVKMGY